MSEQQHHYGTGFTSVKVHQNPGGDSTFSLSWDDGSNSQPKEPPRKIPSETDEEQKRKEEEQKQRDEEEGKRKQEQEKLREEERKQRIAEEEKAPQAKAKVPPGGYSSITFG